MGKIKAVFFDLDDTLYNSYAYGNECALKAIAKFAQDHMNVDGDVFVDAFLKGKDFTRKALGKIASSHNRLLYAQKACEILDINSMKYASDIAELYWETAIGVIELKPDTLKVLEYLKEKKIKTCLCTNLTVDIQHKKVKKLGICDYIDFMLSSEEAGADKPDTVMLEKALIKTKCKKDEVIMVGDSFGHDVVCAYNFGIQPVWLNEEDIEPSHPIPNLIIVKSLSEIIQYL